MEDQTITIHVRFANDGSVHDIGERPEGATAQQWFDRLSRYEGNGYQPLSGGRAVFRVTRVEINALAQGVS